MTTSNERPSGAEARVLLLGEYSGLHRNLAEGLRGMGVHVDVASSGDGWKRIVGDISFDLGRTGLTGSVLRNVVPFLRLPRLRSYDVIQVINPYLLNARFGFNKVFFEALLSGLRAKVFLLACGCDVATNLHFRHAHPFPQICEECKAHDLQGHRCLFEDARQIAFQRRLVERVNGIIPTGSEYADAYAAAAPEKVRPLVPLPFSTRAIAYAPNVSADGVVRVFHGLNRDGFKGTRHVRAAFELAAKRLGSRAEFQVFGRLPLTEYLAATDPVNVVVDQIFGVSYGMNALYQMARGKAVVGGGHRPSLERHGIFGSPIRFTGAAVEDIAGAIVELASDPAALRRLGEAGRDFVETVHDSGKVAARFLAEWGR